MQTRTLGKSGISIAPLAFGGTAPHADLLPVREREVEACLTHVTLLADLLRDLGILVVVGIEDAGIQPPACPQHPPFEFVGRHVVLP